MSMTGLIRSAGSRSAARVRVRICGVDSRLVVENVTVARVGPGVLGVLDSLDRVHRFAHHGFREARDPQVVLGFARLLHLLVIDLVLDRDREIQMAVIESTACTQVAHCSELKRYLTPAKIKTPIPKPATPNPTNSGSVNRC